MFEHKEYVERIYQERSFRKAAEKLHVSQPALSAMIKRLEKELGVPLFNRKTNPISLTSFGSEYLKSAGIVTDLESRLKNMAYEDRTALYGTLTLCAFSLALPTRIARKIAAFHASFPGIRLYLQNHNTLQAKMSMDSYQGDLLISTKNMDPEKYTGISLYQEHLVLVVPKRFSDTERFTDLQLDSKQISSILEPDCPALPLKDFQSVPFILASRENYIRECANMLFQEAQIHPPVEIETESSSVALNFVRLGCGATICSHMLLENTAYTNQLCVYKIKSRLAVRTGHLYYRRGAYLTPAMKKFIAWMQEPDPTEE